VESDGEGEGSSVVTAAAAAAAEVVGFMDWGFLVCFSGCVFSPFFFLWPLALGDAGAKAWLGRRGEEGVAAGVMFSTLFVYLYLLFLFPYPSVSLFLVL